MSEIIIDGCNVAECEHLWKDNPVAELHFCRINYDNNYFSNGIPCCDKCNKHPDCYFKQLQRAKSENEKLKKALKEIKEIVNSECKKCPDGTYTEDYCNGLAYCTLAKINEVLNEYNERFL